MSSETKNDAKVVLVTGSSAGIGAETALLYSKRGYKVVITGSNAENVAKVTLECDSVSPPGFKALPIVADMSNVENGAVVVQKTIEHFGKLDILINNVGMARITKPSDKQAFDIYKLIMAVNVDSVIKTTTEALPHLLNTNGRIVFVSSISSVKVSETMSAYHMSKAALTMYARCLALEVANKVRVNIVSPGPVATDIFGKINPGVTLEAVRKALDDKIPMGRLGECIEVANTIFFLTSDEACYIHGVELFVDGGYLLKRD